MSEKTFRATAAQQKAIEHRGSNMLVSASAGTGKTTTMIQRIASLLKEGVDVSEIVVVTFTNLAAAEMRARLAEKLSEIRNDARIVDQLEKLDTAAICTLHSFCGDLLRNYFYVADIDPAFEILDTVTVAALRKNALNDLFAEYFSKDDPVFREVYKIFSTHRREDNFRDTLMRLYDFGRCLEDFPAWYAARRESFVSYSEDNPIARALLSDIAQMLQYQTENMRLLAERADEENEAYAKVLHENAARLAAIPQDNLQKALYGVEKLKLEPLPRKKPNVELSDFEESIRNHYKQLSEVRDSRIKKYSSLCRSLPLEELWREMELSVVHVDKLVELVNRFDELFVEQKKQRGGVDFNDLEHLTLKLLRDEAALADIHSRYKLVFVDEYQDTNPVQEAIVKLLAQPNGLFMVGDVKQSVYGFRGCDPTIFANKYDLYKSERLGEAVELNDNFRSNREILEFVNAVFDGLMTTEFGKVDYRGTAQLRGDASPVLQTASVRIDYVLKTKSEKLPVEGIYDITARSDSEDGIRQGELIANRINEYVGKAYTDAKGAPRRIDYGDVVILMRGMTDKAVDIYNALVKRNIPVAASFKVEGYTDKEVRDIVNLLRVIDNPYNDVPLVGACLNFGELTEQELSYVRLDTEGRVPFYERLSEYSRKNDDIAKKIKSFLEFLEDVRFYSYGASVSEIVLRVMEKKNYALSVSGLVNGGLRLKKLYDFVESIRGASYAQSVDRFLAYVDETNEQSPDVQNAPNAVRLMTMHASKGLEFPVVIVAGLETRFNFDKYALKTNSELGLALNYFNVSTMRTAETVGAFACDLLNRYKQREEEMRLMYVALTRAKYVLDLVASVDDDALTRLPVQPARAMSHLDWLHRALYGRYGEDMSDKGIEVNVFDNVKEAQPVLAGGSLCEQTASVSDVERKLGFVYAHKEACSLPSKVVSSALDKEYIDLTDEPRPEQTLVTDDGNRNEVGTAYHKVYQYVDYGADVERIRECVAALVNDGKIEQNIAERLDAELIFDTLRNPELQALLGGGKVYHEVPFMLSVSYGELYPETGDACCDKVMLQGVIDLLVLGENKATVVDFKYTNRSDLIPRRYSAQLNSYRMAVERICGVENIDCYVLSVADNKLIKM